MTDVSPDHLTQSPQWVFEHVRSYVDEQLRLQQAEIDRRITTTRLELQSLHNLFDRVMSERERAITQAEREREKAAIVLRDKFDDQIRAVRREVELITSASEIAIGKSEAAYHDRFLAHNGLIEQMRQQAAKGEQTLAELVGTLLRRETFETYKEGVERRLNMGVGERRGVRDERRGVRDFRVDVVAVLALLVSIAAAVALIVHG